MIKNTSSKIVYYALKDTTEQRTECPRENRQNENTRQNREQNVLEHDGVKFTSGRVLAIANELGQRKTQLKRYKDILLTGNWYKIS